MRSQRKRLWIREIKFKEEAGLVDRQKKMAEIQVDYKRDMQSSYLVIETEEIPERTYRLPMLMNNRIEGLLEIELRTVDEKNVYYYDISSRQSFACIYEKKTLDSPELKKLIRDIISIITRGKEYLLTKMILLSGRSIFICRFRPARYPCVIFRDIKGTCAASCRDYLRN